MWTLYAAGLNPKGFKKTGAALVQNTYDDPGPDETLHQRRSSMA
jgi:hypothetical protein